MEIGDMLPEFTLPDENNNPVKISDFKGQNIVIYFYPKDDTPGCTKEACTFRDAYEDFKDAGAVVIGISSDSPESHKHFKEKYRLPFILLSDSGNQVKKMFGVKNDLLFIPGRETFVFDKNGKLIYKFKSAFDMKGHCQKALEALKVK
ncbi:MAG: peroxiredoxin [Bacteroidetes bacterium]|nr:MAG: peroxiredoxin [Bacteroidota bacterium]